LANYGLGGICNLTFPALETSPFFLNTTFCKDPADTPGTDIRIWQRTGRANLDDLWVIEKWFGNSSVGFWNTSINGDGTERLETVTGTHSDLQFKTSLDKSDTPTIFDGTAFRRVGFQYQFEHEMYGITLWRFRTNDDLYCGSSDPYYFGAPKGMLNVSTPSLIVHGGVSPMYASLAWQAGVDEEVRAGYICSNCPEIDPDLSNDDLNALYGSWVDVNPRLGKTLRGSETSQFSVLIGQDYLFGDENCRKEECPYRNVPEVYLPVIFFNMTVSFNQTQADEVQDGLDELSMADSIRSATLIGGSVLCAVLFITSCVLFGIWRKAQQEEKQLGYPGATYGHVQEDHYRGLPSES